MNLSVIICCYNSEDRLRPTLSALANQTTENVQWEIILVNNNSNDNTSEVAQQLWDEFNCAVPFEIVDEQEPGLSYARRKGVSVALGEYILFCDDDNWLNENYIANACQIMDNDPLVGALCGKNIAVYEKQPDEFVIQYEEAFAVGHNNLDSCYLDGRRAPWGAGLVLRKQFLDKLESLSFLSLLSDRKGSELSSGGDTELCYLLRLCCYKWKYDTLLELKHYIPKERSNFEYLKKLYYGFGKANLVIDWYYKYGVMECFKQEQPSWLKVYFNQLFQNLISQNSNKNVKVNALNKSYSKGYMDQLKMERVEFEKKATYIKEIVNQMLLDKP